MRVYKHFYLSVLGLLTAASAFAIPSSVVNPAGPISMPASGGTQAFTCTGSRINGYGGTGWMSVPTIDYFGCTLTLSVAANTTISPRTNNFTVTVDNVQYLVQIQQAADFSVAPATHGVTSAAGTGSVAVTAPVGGNWTALSNRSWLTIDSGSSGSGNGTVSYSYTANTAQTPRSATLTIGSATFDLTQDALEVDVTANPTTVAAIGAAGSYQVSVTGTPSTAPWIASTATPWITLGSTHSGSGAGTLSFDVAANTSIQPRSGSITIANATVTVNQAGLTGDVTLSSTSDSVTHTGGGLGLTATANATDYAWTAVSNNDWIVVTNGASTTGTGSVGLLVEQYMLTQTRTGTVTVGGKTFTVSQTGLPGFLKLGKSQVEISGTGGSDTVAATANASDFPWTASSDQTWATITSGASGTGNGTIEVQAAASTSVNPRTATVTVANTSFGIVQSGLTGSLSLSETSFNAQADGDTRTITATSNATDYNWTAVSNTPWITVTAGASGTGNGSVGVQLAATDSVYPRTGTVTIGDQELSITQGGGTGSVTLSHSTLTPSSDGGSNTITVTTNYSDHPWNVESGANWITILTGHCGVGDGAVSLQVEPTDSVHPRTATVTIGSQVLTITQAGGIGSLKLSESTLTLPSSHSSTTIQVKSNYSDYIWTTTSNTSWIIPGSATTVTGDGSVSLDFEATNSAHVRTGAVTIGDRTLTVSQEAGKGSITLNPGHIVVDATGGDRTISVKANYSDFGWTTSSNSPWATIMSPSTVSGNGTVSVHIDPLDSYVPRTATLQIGNQSLTIDQRNDTVVTPDAISLTGITGGTSVRQNLSVSSGAPGVPFRVYVTPAAPWLTLTSTEGATPSSFALTADPSKLTPGVYTSSLSINERYVPVTLTVKQPGVAVSAQSLTFQRTSKSAVLAPQALLISSDGPVTFTAEAGSTVGNWLSLDHVSGSAPGAIQVRASTTGLTGGEYFGTITLRFSGSSDEQISVPVTLRLPVFDVTIQTSGNAPAPSANTIDELGNGRLAFQATQQAFQPNGPAPAVLSVTSGNQPRAFTAAAITSSGGAWLDVTPKTGTTPSSVSVSVNRDGLAPGTYSGTVTITPQGDGPNVPTTLAVTFTVNAPVITLGLEPASWTAVQAVNSDCNYAFAVDVLGVKGDTFYAAASAPWITVTPANGKVPNVVTVRVNPPANTAVDLAGSVAFTSSGNPGQPTLLPIAISVKPGAPACGLAN